MEWKIALLCALLVESLALQGARCAPTGPDNVDPDVDARNFLSQNSPGPVLDEEKTSEDAYALEDVFPGIPDPIEERQPEEIPGGPLFVWDFIDAHLSFRKMFEDRTAGDPDSASEIRRTLKDPREVDEVSSVPQARRRHGGNAGGSSELSEAASFFIFRKETGAKLVATEKTFGHELGAKLVDYVVDIASKKYGVSVARLFKHRKDTRAQTELEIVKEKIAGKLKDAAVAFQVQESVLEKTEHQFVATYVHFFVPSRLVNSAKDYIEGLLEPKPKGIAVVITETDAPEKLEWLYDNRMSEKDLLWFFCPPVRQEMMVH